MDKLRFFKFRSLSSASVDDPAVSGLDRDLAVAAVSGLDLDLAVAAVSGLDRGLDVAAVSGLD